MLVLSILIIIIDQLSKKIALKTLRGKPSKVIIDGFFELTYIENPGAAFGILKGRQALFVIITILVIAGILFYFYKNYKLMCIVEKISLSLILAGAVGNFIDRLLRGYVIDFFSFQLGKYYFPVFNIADISIVVGTGLLIFIILSSEDSL